MRKVLVTLLLFTFQLFFLNIPMAEARSGCCSHHGGVCGCGCCDGTSLSEKCAPYYPECHSQVPVKTSEPQQSAQPRSTFVPTQKATTPPANKEAYRPATPAPIRKCSAQTDGFCPAYCTAGNDSDCCGNTRGYRWYYNWGCYPTDILCSDTPDGVCHEYCTAGNDADCCDQNLSDYHWFPNWGCYPESNAQCSGMTDGFCPTYCGAGNDADCCTQLLPEYRWYTNRGCYEG